MENRNSVEIPTDEYRKQITEMFKGLVSPKFFAEWEDTFEIECADDRVVIVAYYGTQPTKKFQKECMTTLIFCIRSVFGTDKKIKLQNRNGAKPISPKTKQNIKALKFCVIGMFFIGIAAAVIVVLCSYIDNRNFRETFYNTSSIKVDSPVRIIQISDLHGSLYGQDNAGLLERIEALNPDIIICTGDIVDSATEDADYAVALAAELAQIAPSYYVYGNNEVEGIYDIPLNEKELDQKFGFDSTNRDEQALLELTDTFEEKLEAAGICVLKNEMDTITVKSMTVDIYGVLTSNPSAFWSYSENAFLDYLTENPDHLKITVVHEPFIFEEFAPDFWGDLMLSGHTHGGVIRVPILGPLYTGEGGLFPERGGAYVYGRYDTQGTPLIVSSGLENSNIFRINNQPELVIIDINRF